MRIVAFVVVFLLATSVQAGALVEFGSPTNTEFAPARGERFRLPLTLKVPAEVELRILTADGDLVTSIRPKGLLSAGSHELEWDGKDAQGSVVPDEAYVPVLVAHGKDGKTEVVDPRSTSGGEAVEEVKVQTSPNGDIGYTLPVPARVLIRVGVKEGPMLRSLANWVPHAPGKNVQRWNGFDQEQLLDLRTNPKLTLLVMAFRLPEPAIITYGNSAFDYRAYRVKKGWSESVAQPADPSLERNGQRISRSYYQPRFKDENPKLSLSPLTKLSLSQDGVQAINAPVGIRVDIAPEDRWLMQESLYEVGFFIDNAFVSEEEHGYVPFTWQLDPAPLEAGRHLLTVNISGLDGKTAVKSLLFDVIK